MPTNTKYFSKFEHLFPEITDSAWLSISCRKGDYSASRIARAVEDADAHLINLNVTSLPADGDSLVVSLRVNHRNPISVIRSLARYGYHITTGDGVFFSYADTDGTDSEPGPIETLKRYLEI